MTAEEMLKNIEICRKKMISKAALTSFSHKEVILASEELDVLLNQYDDYIRRKQ